MFPGTTEHQVRRVLGREGMAAGWVAADRADLAGSSEVDPSERDRSGTLLG